MFYVSVMNFGQERTKSKQRAQLSQVGCGRVQLHHICILPTSNVGV
jgi:hypothetical protein